MPTYKNTNYSMIYVMLAMIVICCLSIAGPRIIQPGINNIAGFFELREFENAFREIKHPPGTENISLHTKLGEFGGNEHGCDFFIGEVRHYEESEDFNFAAYIDQEVRAFPLQVLILDDGQIPNLAFDTIPAPLNNLAEWKLPSNVEQQSLYIVYLLVLDYEGDLKLNCQ